MISRSIAVLATLFLSTCLLISAGQTQTTGPKTGVLLGDVADKAENAPIRYAFVYIHSQGRTGDTFPSLDGSGRFRVSLAPGLYAVFVAAAGFSPTCAVISVDADRTITFSPRLGPDLEHLEQ